MDAIAYEDLRSRISSIGIGGEHGEHTEWLFTAGDLNTGKSFWDDDFIDDIDFFTKGCNIHNAVQRIAGIYGFKIVY